MVANNDQRGEEIRARRLFDDIGGYMTRGTRVSREVADVLQVVHDDPNFYQRLFPGQPVTGALDNPLNRSVHLASVGRKSLRKLIRTGKFRYVNLDIKAKNFPDIGIKTDFKVYYPQRVISSDGMVAEMWRDGYRPANLRELLIWAEKNWNGEDWVAALGQSWRVGGGLRHVPGLYFGDGRKLGLGWYGGDWDADYRFLAVRNS